LAQTGKPLLIIAEDIEGEAPGDLGHQQLARHVPVCRASRPSGYGDRRKAMLEDIAVLRAAGKPIFEALASS